MKRIKLFIFCVLHMCAGYRFGAGVFPTRRVIAMITIGVIFLVPSLISIIGYFAQKHGNAAVSLLRGWAACCLAYG